MKDYKDPFYKYQNNFIWGTSHLYQALKNANKPKERSEFDIEFNGYFYEYSDIGDLIMCYLIDKMINQHIDINE